jgi:hypothetical protein
MLERRTGVVNNIWVSVLLLAIGLAAPRAIHAADASNKTRQNLQSAYSSESNAHVKYLELAKQADSEGYGKVASLFRAAAAAVQIHLTCEATVIKEMDAMPQTDVKAAPVKFVFGAAGCAVSDRGRIRRDDDGYWRGGADMCLVKTLARCVRQDQKR